MRVAVIGAGAAGLAAAKHLTTRSDQLFTCVVFEQTGCAGGVWVYTDRVGDDDFGLPITNSMYKSLKTNLPAEAMGYPDFPLASDEEYIPANEVLQFLERYKNHFNLDQHIKYYHHVTCVKPKSNVGGWSVDVVDLKNKREENYDFDAVMVCNGHYSVPHVPEYPGAKDFLGEQVHCHDYRTPDRFQDKAVLVIGAGYSARDISVEIATVAKQVILSHHLKSPISTDGYPDSTVQKPDIKSIATNSVTFQDGSSCENVDIILYGTGYLFNFSFLDASCMITVDDNFVQPLYKHMINIELPTMCFVGIPLYVSPFPLFDLQVQYFLSTLAGTLALPPRADMLADTEREMSNRRSVPCFTSRKAHMMGPLQEAYCNELCDVMGIPHLPAVIFKRLKQSLCSLIYSAH